MVGREARWFLRELPGLIEGGVIDSRVAERLRAYYEPRSSRRGGATLLVAVFGVLGAVLIAAGILLLFAHNWDRLSRELRTAMAFTPLLAAQAFAVWVRLRRFDSLAWREGISGFLTLSIGGCIALVGQIYQIPGDTGSFVLTWSALALPLIYLLDSRMTLTLYWVGITSYLFCGYTEIVEPERLTVFGLLAGLSAPALLGLARGASRLRLSLPAWLVSSCIVAASLRIVWGSGGVVWLVVLAGLFGAMYGAGSLMAEGGNLWRQPLRAIGAVGAGIGLVIVSYREVWEEITRFVGWGEDSGTPSSFAALGIGLVLAAVALLAGLRLMRDRHWHEASTAWLILPVTGAWLLGFADEGHTASMLLMNLFGVGLGVVTCVDGLRQGRLGSANFGLLLAAAVLTARFFDADWSFVVRGVGFVLLGLVFLGMNLRLLARRKEATT